MQAKLPQKVFFEKNTCINGEEWLYSTFRPRVLWPFELPPSIPFAYLHLFSCFLCTSSCGKESEPRKPSRVLHTVQESPAAAACVRLPAAATARSVGESAGTSTQYSCFSLSVSLSLDSLLYYGYRRPSPPAPLPPSPNSRVPWKKCATLI